MLSKKEGKKIQITKLKNESGEITAEFVEIRIGRDMINIYAKS